MHNCSVELFQTDKIRYGHIYTLDFSSEMPQRTHNHWSFMLVKSGELTYTADGTACDLAPGSLVITRPGSVRTLWAKGTITYDRHSITIAEELLDKEILEQLPPDLHVLDVSDNQIIQNIYEKVHFYLSNLPKKQMESTLHSMTCELLMNIYISTQTSLEQTKHKTDPLIAEILTYIGEHIREPLTVSQISNAMSISTGYLHLYFSKQMNMTVKKYVTQQKLLLVQKELNNGVNPTEACRRYGFRSYSTFYRNYQNAYGCRPSNAPQQSLEKIEL